MRRQGCAACRSLHESFRSPLRWGSTHMHMHVAHHDVCQRRNDAAAGTHRSPPGWRRFDGKPAQCGNKHSKSHVIYGAEQVFQRKARAILMPCRDNCHALQPNKIGQRSHVALLWDYIKHQGDPRLPRHHAGHYATPASRSDPRTTPECTGYLWSP